MRDVMWLCFRTDRRTNEQTFGIEELLLRLIKFTKLINELRYNKFPLTSHVYPQQWHPQNLQPCQTCIQGTWCKPPRVHLRPPCSWGRCEPDTPWWWTPHDRWWRLLQRGCQRNLQILQVANLLLFLVFCRWCLLLMWHRLHFQP